MTGVFDSGVSPDRRHNNFDLLRLLAAWFVLFSHSYPLSGQPVADPFARNVGIDTLGGIGVAIFFVLSGYLVPISRERSRTSLEFVRKRALRIFPALAVVTILCVLLLGTSLTTLATEEYLRHPQTRAYFWNIVAWNIHYGLPGVFAGNPAPNAVNGSLWSLPYEIRCYLILAILWFLPLPRKVIASVVVLTLAAMLSLRPLTPPAGVFDKYMGADYYTVKLSLYFCIGAWFAVWRSSVRPPLLLGVCVAAGAILMSPSQIQTTLFVAGFSVLVLAIGLHPGLLPKLPERMGDWSYGLYLYGFPVQQVLALAGLGAAGVAGFTLASTVLATICAALSWFLIEKPALTAFKERRLSSTLVN